MAFQVLQVKDALGNVYDLATLTPSSLYAVLAHDPDVYNTLHKKFGASLGTANLISSVGDNSLVTPTTGKALRLKWFAMATSETNAQEVVVTVKLGTSVLYKWPMGAPGAFSHGSVREGAVNADLIVNLSAAVPVYINYEYEEF